MSIRGIEIVRKLIVLRKQQVELLEELLRNLLLAERVGVDPNEIDKYGYDQSKDKRWNKWPPHMKVLIKPEANYVVLKDGTRIDFEIDWEGPMKVERDKRLEKFRFLQKRN